MYTSEQIGPGIVNLTFDSPFGEGCFLQVLTHIEPLMQHMITHIYMKRRTPTIIAKLFLCGYALQVQRSDIISTICYWASHQYDTVLFCQQLLYTFYDPRLPRLRN